jgi:hypothetical protein
MPYLPIPCGVQRWNEIKKNQDVISLIVDERTLGWPLTKNELETILYHYAAKVYIFDTSDLLVVDYSDFKWPEGCSWFFDHSQTDRFTQTKKNVSNVQDIVVDSAATTKFQKTVKQLMERLTVDLEVLNKSTDVGETLDKQRTLMFQMLMNGADEVKVYGVILENVLWAPLRNN